MTNSEVRPRGCRPPPALQSGWLLSAVCCDAWNILIEQLATATWIGQRKPARDVWSMSLDIVLRACCLPRINARSRSGKTLSDEWEVAGIRHFPLKARERVPYVDSEHLILRKTLDTTPFGTRCAPPKTVEAWPPASRLVRPPRGLRGNRRLGAVQAQSPSNRLDPPLRLGIDHLHGRERIHESPSENALICVLRAHCFAQLPPADLNSELQPPRPQRSLFAPPHHPCPKSGYRHPSKLNHSVALFDCEPHAASCKCERLLAEERVAPVSPTCPTNFKPLRQVRSRRLFQIHLWRATLQRASTGVNPHQAGIWPVRNRLQGKCLAVVELASWEELGNGGPLNGPHTGSRPSSGTTRL